MKTKVIMEKVDMEKRTGRLGGALQGEIAGSKTGPSHNRKGKSSLR